MAQTLEQLRAADAWARAQGCSDEYQKLAKGVPTLIMNSGLMQVLVFLHEKGEKPAQIHCAQLGEHLRLWLTQRFPSQFKSAEFRPFMEALMKAGPSTFQDITTEAFDWLRWARQMAAAAYASQAAQTVSKGE